MGNSGQHSMVSRSSQRQNWWSQAWWHSLRLRPRLALAALAAFLVAVPVTFLALAARTGWGPVKRLDLDVADALHTYVGERPWLLDVLHTLDAALHPWVFRATILVLVIVLLVRGALRLAWWAAITMATGSLLG